MLPLRTICGTEVTERETPWDPLTDRNPWAELPDERDAPDEEPPPLGWK